MSIFGGLAAMYLFWAGVAPKSFGKHLAEITLAYRAALQEKSR